MLSKVALIGALLLLHALLSGCGGEPLPASPVYDGEGNLLRPLKEPLKDVNVLLLSIDTLRADHLGCYGYHRPISPHIDGLAEQGILFSQALSASPWTTPSQISILTSLQPSVHGVFAYPFPGSLDPGVVTLAEILRKQGFRTAGFTEGGYAKGATGLGHGFETFPEWPGDRESYFSHELAPSRLEENTNRLLAWLKQNSRERFFLFFQTYEPHFEYRPPLEYLQIVNPDFSAETEERALREAVARWNQAKPLSVEEEGILYRHFLQGDLNEFPLKRGRELTRVLHAFPAGKWKTSPTFRTDLAYIIDLYDAEILFTDACVGRIMEELKELELLDSTLIVFTSDHGEGLMDHGIVYHGKNLYDELLRVPLILRLPDGSGAGTTISDLVRTTDIMPTVLDFLGLPANRDAQGMSLLPLLAGRRSFRESLGEGLSIKGGEHDLVSLRTDRWKYVRHSRDGAEELYDLEQDPGEKVDVSDRFPEVVKDLRERLSFLGGKNQKAAQKFSTAGRAFSEEDRGRLESLGYIVE